MSTITVLAEFDSASSLMHAAEELSEKGYKDFETYSPFPIHGMDKAMRLKPSVLPWIVLFGGFFGLTGGFGMQTWMSAIDYKIIISGKPYFSYHAFIPVTFELMILLSAFAAVFGMFGLNKLPQYYHRVFKGSRFRRVTDDAFFIGVDSTDKQFDLNSVKVLLKELNGTNIEVLED